MYYYLACEIKRYFRNNDRAREVINTNVENLDVFVYRTRSDELFHSTVQIAMGPGQNSLTGN